MTTWFYMGVGQMTMIDHEGGQNFRKSDHVVYGCPLTAQRSIVHGELFFSIKGIFWIKNSEAVTLMNCAKFDHTLNLLMTHEISAS